MTRHFWVLAHRYAGLYLAFFLTVAGLTGSILAFYHELDHWLNPRQRVAIPATPMLSPFELRELALALEPHARITGINLQPEPGVVYSTRFAYEALTDPATGKPYELRHAALNPYTGAALTVEALEPAEDGAMRFWPLTRKNILPFIYALHYSLALDEFGVWLFGIAATIWTVDCFIGFYLTLPRQRKKAPATAQNPQPLFWRRWQLAWKIKWPSSPLRLNFDLHRASGLWTWLMLLMFAWSSVMFNMNEWVYRPLMTPFFELTDFKNLPSPDLPKPKLNPAIDFNSAYPIGQQLMAEQARQKGFRIITERGFNYIDSKGLYVYSVKSDRDISDNGGSTHVYFNADTGKFVTLFLPSGEKTGDTVTGWLASLHMASIWGLPYRILVCAMGLVVAMLSITGVYLWLKKRQAARFRRKALGEM